MRPTNLDRIFTAYTDADRVYHTLDHISGMLNLLRHGFMRVQNLDPRSLQALTWAIYYHDIVYDPRAPYSQNEYESSNLMQEDMHDAGVEQAVIQIAVHAVVSTIDHLPRRYNPVPVTSGRVPFGSYESNVMIDLDLAGLGFQWKMYMANAVRVREEYRHLNDEQWNRGRREFLTKFLDRETIYHTAWGVDQFEKRARTNLTRELNILENET